LVPWSHPYFLFRYFSSAPLPTVPDKLPRPAPKQESRASDFNSHDGPTVLSPSRKSKRVMRERDGFEGNAYKVHKIDEHLDEIRLAAGGNTSRNEPVPLSVDFSIFGAKPPNRPTINR
jgi:cyclin-dependent kinase 7